MPNQRNFCRFWNWPSANHKGLVDHIWARLLPSDNLWTKLWVVAKKKKAQYHASCTAVVELAWITRCSCSCRYICIQFQVGRDVRAILLDSISKHACTHNPAEHIGIHAEEVHRHKRTLTTRAHWCHCQLEIVQTLPVNWCEQTLWLKRLSDAEID